MMRNRGFRFVLTIASMMLVTSGCGGRPPLAPTMESIQANVFNIHCAVAECHVAPNPESGLILEDGVAARNLVGVPSTGIHERLRVAPGRPDESYLLDKLRGERIVGERMPLGRAPLPDSLVRAIESWISAGAPHS